MDRKVSNLVMYVQGPEEKMTQWDKLENWSLYMQSERRREWGTETSAVRKEIYMQMEKQKFGNKYVLGHRLDFGL